MTRFHYVRQLLSRPPSRRCRSPAPARRLLAGGTKLLVRLQSGRIRPAGMVDLKRIETLESGMARVDSVLRIGARCTMAELIANRRIGRRSRRSSRRREWSVRCRSAIVRRWQATSATRRPRPTPAPPLLAYRAIVYTRGIAGERRVPLRQFFTGPGQTVLGCDEIVTSIDLPLPDWPGRRGVHAPDTPPRGGPGHADGVLRDIELGRDARRAGRGRADAAAGD